ncbi:hypothetical protein RB595_007807 [Gaeumannomyces hyphopodioides]
MRVPQAMETPGESSTEFSQPLREESSGLRTTRTLPSLIYTSHDNSHELRGAIGATNGAPSSQTEGSDVCRDLGDNFTYSTVENPQQHLSVSSTRSTPEASWQPLPHPPTDNIIEDERQPTDQLLAGISGDRPSSEAPGLTRLQLEMKLRRAMVTTSLTATKDEMAKYLPRGALSKLVTESSVAAVLQSEGMPRDESEPLAKKICIPSPVKLDGGRKGQNQKSTRRKLFATLVMMSKVKAIGCFIDEGIFDTHLPLHKTPDGDFLSLSTRPKEQIDCCKNWSVNDAELFDYHQWPFLSPFFADLERIKDEKAKVMHYVLQPRIVPPLQFPNTEVSDPGAEAETEVNGGFSTVFRVKFHPDHHDFGPESERSNLVHALKKLHSPNKPAFHREVEALKRFSHSDDRHLIKLLWTYEWRGSFYLVFPCADGNLWDFTKRYADGPELTQTRPRKVWVRWLAEQCYGVAAALSRIHGADLSSPNGSKASGSSAKLSPLQTLADTTGGKYGRHGDLKPENILWFSADNTTAGRDQTIGVLQVSDFGLSDFHSRYSKSGIPANQFLLSGTYQAPESLVSNSLAQSYDIWTLGCVYVQFISWFLLGHEKTKVEFSKKRVDDDDQNLIKEDTFFKVETENGHPVGAVVKKSVLDWIARLTEHRDCSAFLDELLCYILSDMLVAPSQSRATCPQVAKSLHRMLERCKTDLSYCLKRSGSPESPRLPTFMPIIKYSASEQEVVLDSLARKGRRQTFPPEPPTRCTLLRTLSEPEVQRPTSHPGQFGSSPPGELFRPPSPFKGVGVAEEARAEPDRQLDHANVPSRSGDLPAPTLPANEPRRQEQASGTAANVGPTGVERDADPERYHSREEQERGWGDKLKHLCISCCCCFS